jgi:GT2 family glycosyltransferase
MLVHGEGGPAKEIAAALALRRIEELQTNWARDKRHLSQLEIDLEKIYKSDGWRVLNRYYLLRNRLVPVGSRRHKLVRAFWRCARGLAKAGNPHQMEDTYQNWIKTHEPNARELKRQRKHRFNLRPRISIAVPMYQTPLKFLASMIDSVRQQTYSDWELCLADGHSPDPAVRRMLRRYAALDPRIRVAFLPENRGIAGNTNAAIELATGAYVALLDHDDTLAPFALYEVVQAINQNPAADFIYSDEDRLDEKELRVDYHFKPDWSPDALRCHNYICHLMVVERDLLLRIGGFRPGFDGSQDYDLALRGTEQARAVVHIPKVLYHWRKNPASFTAGPRLKEAQEAALRAIQDHLRRTGIAGTARHNSTIHTFQVERTLPRQPLVSIVIPTQDQQPTLARCLESIARSTYTHYEILLVENGSKESATFAYYKELEKNPRVRLLTWDRPFNYAAVNNFAARQARGEILLMLNNDTEAINRDWLERMLEHALRPEVGIVGAKLYYPNDTIQHAGVVMDAFGLPCHIHHNSPAHSGGYVHRLVITQNLSAVTGACAMMRKQVFEEIGSFDERFVLAYNDVDLCLQCRQHGYWVVWTPHAEMYHHESMTRGPEDTLEKQSRFEAEKKLLQSKWPAYGPLGDPFLNPNLALNGPNLTLRL